MPTRDPVQMRADASREFFSGIVERVTFHSPDTGFCVVRVQARGRRDLVTLVGCAASVVPGEHVQATGRWVNDRTHGLQFKADWLRVAPPDSAEAIERYFGSGLIKGIGRHYAKRLVEAFGADVFTVIEREPDRLRDVPGVGPVRASSIATSWREQRAIRDIMLFLHQHGVSTARAVRVFKTYGIDAVKLISENPYRLARDIRGVGFVSADRIAERLGIEKTAMIRVRAGLGYRLGQALDEGHCGLPRDVLLSESARQLEVSSEIVEQALALELSDGALVPDTVDGEACVFLAALHSAERRLAQRLRALAGGRPPWPAIDVDRAQPWAEARLQLALSERQAQAFRAAVREKVLIITGGPGVGKTTLLRAILAVLAVKGVKSAICAPTGRAAKRLSDATGLEARTIHRLLEVNPRTGGFRRDESNPIDAQQVVVDEVSMVDVPLMWSLVRAVRPDAALLLVGDADQLPSVGPGQVLADLIASAAVPVIRLTDIFRQAATSRIIVNAHRVNQGEMPDLQPSAVSDFHFVEADDPELAMRKLLQIVRERIPSRYGLHPFRDVQVLCPMNRGSLGARTLNVELQRALNPPGPDAIERFGYTFGVGDKVMQIENDYDKDVYNGDLGVVVSVDRTASDILVDFDGRRVTYEFGELDRLVLAYATTIHKAQGSEYPAVVIPLTTQHYLMLRRNLLYTGITRGRKLVVLIGQVRALAIAVKGTQAKRRWSKLREWLTGGRAA
ncbi:MAG: ATP-dependent RecD-like DNA helicase [Luteitalea sp.]|nr:ATP-dependent RecD-like DNA helicase [Luteitalea sp.]